MSIADSLITSVIVLPDVDWETYERLRNAEGNRNLRMTYDRGILEIMSPSKLHERLSELLGRLILVWTEEKRIPIQSGGSTTLKKTAQRRGLEPDKCFFIESETAVRARDEHDPAIDPSPDLAIEVDVSSSSELRMPIYADLGIREVWRWKQEQLILFVLHASGQYHERGESVVLSGFPLGAAAELLQRRNASDETSLVADFRDRVRRG
jgi:Uma2 family endonuclease